jgi:hypothetical protein
MRCIGRAVCPTKRSARQAVVGGRETHMPLKLTVLAGISRPPSTGAHDSKIVVDDRKIESLQSLKSQWIALSGRGYDEHVNGTLKHLTILRSTFEEKRVTELTREWYNESRNMPLIHVNSRRVIISQSVRERLKVPEFERLGHQ